MAARAKGPTEQARSVLICVNPRAGWRSRREKVDRLAALLREAGFGVTVETDLARVADAANRAAEEGHLRALVGAGGDGTAAELVNRTESHVPLVMLPLGVENLLARHLGHSRAPEQLLETIDQGVPVRLDAGRANGRLFLLMVGCGFDAEVVRRVHEQRTGHIHQLTYFKPILSAIRNYEYPPLRVYCEERPSADDRVPTVTAAWTFAFNLPRYGGGLAIAPQADGSDGLLDVVTFRRGSLWHGLRYLAFVLCRCHGRLGDCTMRRVRRVRIEADRPVPYQIDGDPGGWLPLVIETVPGRVTAIVSPTWARSHGFQGPSQLAADGAGER